MNRETKELEIAIGTWLIRALSVNKPSFLNDCLQGGEPFVKRYRNYYGWGWWITPLQTHPLSPISPLTAARWLPPPTPTGNRNGPRARFFVRMSVI